MGHRLYTPWQHESCLSKAPCRDRELRASASPSESRARVQRRASTRPGEAAPRSKPRPPIPGFRTRAFLEGSMEAGWHLGRHTARPLIKGLAAPRTPGAEDREAPPWIRDRPSSPAAGTVIRSED